MKNNTHYQLSTLAESPSEINVTGIYGMHVIPTIELSEFQYQKGKKLKITFLC